MSTGIIVKLESDAYERKLLNSLQATVYRN
jgi:hypothetical protein